MAYVYINHTRIYTRNVYAVCAYAIRLAIHALYFKLQLIFEVPSSCFIEIQPLLARLHSSYEIRNNWCTLIEVQKIAYTVVIHGCLDTRVETRCAGGVSISYMASRSRHFSYFEIVFSFQLLVKFSINHAKKSLTVHLYINLLFHIITSLWCRPALDNHSEFELVTMVITDYMNEVMSENWDSISWHGMRNTFL